MNPKVRSEIPNSKTCPKWLDPGSCSEVPQEALIQNCGKNRWTAAEEEADGRTTRPISFCNKICFFSNPIQTQRGPKKSLSLEEALQVLRQFREDGGSFKDVSDLLDQLLVRAEPG